MVWTVSMIVKSSFVCSSEFFRRRFISLARWIKQTFAELHLPNPAYVLAGTLMMGFVLGLNFPSDTVTDNADAVQALSFVDPDEGLL